MFTIICNTNILNISHLLCHNATLFNEHLHRGGSIVLVSSGAGYAPREASHVKKYYRVYNTNQQ